MYAKVGLFTDDISTGKTITHTLCRMNYATISMTASHYMKTLQMVECEKPDILLVDINLNGKEDGIDLARKICAKHHLPFIYLHHNADAATIAKARETRPSAFLIKPCSGKALYAAIEICLYNFSGMPQAAPAARKNDAVQDFIFIKQGQEFRKTLIKDILYIESSNVYIHVNTVADKILVRNTLSGYLDLLHPAPFVRIHRCFAVNTAHIQTIAGDHVVVNGYRLPLSKVYREALLKELRLG